MPKVEFPKTIKEKLAELMVEDSISIPREKRQVFANAICNLEKVEQKRFTIRTIDGDIRVWRLK